MNNSMAQNRQWHAHNIPKNTWQKQYGYKADNVKTAQLKFLYTLGPQYTGQRKAKEILAILNSFDIFSYK